MDVSIDPGLFSPGAKDTSGNNICQWRYDGFGRLTASSDPDLGYTGLRYNGFGDIVRRTDGLDRVTTMRYDSLGRMIHKDLPGGEGRVLYAYDTIPRSENSLGRIVLIDDRSQRKTFSYDKMGRIDKETRAIKDPRLREPHAFVTSFEYDLLNRKRLIVYPRDPRTGVSVTARYSFSGMGATAVEVHNSMGRKDIISNILYNEFGQMAEVTRGNGTDTHYVYDIKGRLSSLVTYTKSNNQQRKLQDVSYTFKIDNSISSTINTPDIDTNGGYLSTVRYDYEYDGLNRLVKAQGMYTKGTVPNSGTQEIAKRYESGYHYASNGNMTKKDIFDPATSTLQDSQEYIYSGNNHAVTSIRSSSGAERFSMRYDAVGNMIEERSPLNPPGGDLGFTSKRMEYDSYNRITKVTNPDKHDDLIGQYWYDDQGFRVRKLATRKVAGEMRQVEVLYPSMYFGLEKQRDSRGREIRDTSYAVNNIYLDGVRIAAVIPSGDARYYLTDQVDSVKVVADDAGRAVTRTEYMPYGDTWFQEGDENNAPKYNSQELDRESGLYYYNARHYDAGIAKFVTADSIIDGQYDTQGWNRYSYVKGNPIVYKDPTGHETEEQIQAQELQKTVNYVKNENTENVLKDFDLQSQNKDTATESNVKDKMQKANDSVITKGSNDKKPDFGSPLEGLTKADQLKESTLGGLMTSGTGYRTIEEKKEYHAGIDLAANQGTEIKASAKGKISFRQEKDEKGNLKGFGNYAIIEHEGGYSTYYGHMNEKDWQKYKEQYSKDSNVEKGKVIGGVGHSGRSVGKDPIAPRDHLHFEIRKDGKQDQNTEELLKQSMGKGG